MESKQSYTYRDILKYLNKSSFMCSPVNKFILEEPVDVWLMDINLPINVLRRRILKGFSLSGKGERTILIKDKNKMLKESVKII